MSVEVRRWFIDREVGEIILGVGVYEIYVDCPYYDGFSNHR